MSTKTFNLSLPEELVKELDKQAKKDYSSRSEFIRRAIINQLDRKQSLRAILDEANAKGRAMGITSEQQVYDIIDGKTEPPK